jgi:hypothetical protein
MLFSGVSAQAKTRSDGPKFSVEDAVNGPDFTEVKSIALDILKTYPPSEYLYIGEGRSPTPVIAMLKAMVGDQIAYDIPLSALAKVGSFDQVSNDDAYDLTQEQFEYVQKVLGRVMPSNETIAGRKVLLIDFASTGKTIVAATGQVSSFLERRGAKPQIRVEALALIRNDVVEHWLRREGLDTLWISATFNRHLLARAYSELAEYNSLPVDVPQSEVKVSARNPRFDELIQGYRARVREDKALLSELASLNLQAEALKGVSHKELVREKTSFLSKCIAVLTGR